MLQSLKALLKIMRADPSISHELPFVQRLMSRTFGWLVLAEVVFVLQMFPLKYFIQEYSQPDRSIRTLLLIAAVAAVISTISLMLRYKMSIMRNATFWRMWYIWWNYGNRRQLLMSSDWHTQHSTGEKESIIGKNIERFQKMFDQFVFDTLPTFIRIAVITVAMYAIGWQFGVFATLTLIAYGLVMLNSERHLQQPRLEFLAELKELERLGTELNVNWRTIKQIGREEDFADMNAAKLLQFWENEQPRNRQFESHMRNQETVLVASSILLFVLLAISLSYNPLSVGLVVLAQGWMAMTYSNLWKIADFQRELNQGSAAMRELVDILLLPPTVQQAELPQWPEPVKGKVVFDNLSFTYPQGQDHAIAGMSWEVEPYTSVALVGKSGSGKSTLMSLLQREYDPTEGRILIDGIDLRDIDYTRLRREMIGIVSQTVQLFDGTILDNIRVTMPDATEAEVEEVAKLAHAHDFIMDTEHGYQTKIGDNGIRLSGGQRQRLAIARALLRRPAILIMDEATSSLDAISQKHIQEAVDDLIAQRRCTLFIIAHRFSTIMSADKVAVLDNGRLAELGTHEQLARKNGLYARLREMELDGLLD